MDLEDAHLRQADDGADVVGDQVFANLGFLLDAHAAERRRRPDLRMLQEETIAVQSLRAPQERERPAGDVRHDPAGDRFVVARDVQLRQLQIGIENPIGM